MNSEAEEVSELEEEEDLPEVVDEPEELIEEEEDLPEIVDEPEELIEEEEEEGPWDDDELIVKQPSLRRIGKKDIKSRVYTSSPLRSEPDDHIV